MRTRLPYGLRCVALSILLLAGITLAVELAPDYRQARLIALLQPLIQDRTALLFGSSSRFARFATNVYGWSDRDLQAATDNYPSLIARFRSLHPEIKSDFRNDLAGLMDLELVCFKLEQQFRSARDSMSDLATKSCRPRLDDPCRK